MRVSTLKTLVRLNVKEAVLSPGFTVAVSLGAIFGYLVVRGFVFSIGSQGFDVEQFPLFGNFIATLEGMFGRVVILRLFAQGPFLAGAILSFVPVTFYLAASSILKYHLELDAGAIELVLVGPVDHRSVIVALVVKDILLLGVSVLFLLLFFLATAVANNLLLGPGFFLFLGLSVLLGFVLFAWAQLCSVMTGSGIGSLSLFSLFVLLFFLIYAGSFSVITEELRAFFLTLSHFLQWVSPFFYTGIVMSGIERGSWFLAGAGGVAMVTLATVLLFLATVVGRRGGVVS